MTSLVSWTLSFLRPYKGRSSAIVALTLLEIGLAALAPWPLKLVVDTVLGDTPLPASMASRLPASVVASAAALLVLIVLTVLVLIYPIASALLRRNKVEPVKEFPLGDE